MADKLINVLIWVALAAVALGIVFFLVQPLIWEYETWVIYVRLFLVMFAVSTLAQLRLYNAIVQNTRFSIKLREALLKFNLTVPALERSMKNLNSTMGNIKASSDLLRRSIDHSTGSVEELSGKVDHIKK